MKIKNQHSLYLANAQKSFQVQDDNSITYSHTKRENLQVTCKFLLCVAGSSKIIALNLKAFVHLLDTVIADLWSSYVFVISFRSK